jgi:hypothetical protein
MASPRLTLELSLWSAAWSMCLNGFALESVPGVGCGLNDLERGVGSCSGYDKSP